mgnify:CR=1 FL=1
MPRLDQPSRERASDHPAAAHHQHPPARLRLRNVLLRALGSGSLASVLSSIAVSAWSRGVAGSVPAGTNATSQWAWGRPARHADGWSLRHTLLGYAIHHASSVFWATGYEAWCARAPRRPLAKAATVAALAYVVDYHVVPRRLSPGFENRVSAPGMVCVYGSFALGLALVRLVGGARHRSGAPRAPGRAVLGQPRQHAQQQRRG